MSRDGSKWFITKWGGVWNVYPPVQSIWGALFGTGVKTFDTGDEALAYFRLKTHQPPENLEPWHGQARSYT